jgi:hypothetical protein
MTIIFYPEDLPKDFKGNKKNPSLTDLFEVDTDEELDPGDVLLYKYNNQTKVLFYKE